MRHGATTFLTAENNAGSKRRTKLKPLRKVKPEILPQNFRSGCLRYVKSTQKESKPFPLSLKTRSSVSGSIMRSQNKGRGAEKGRQRGRKRGGEKGEREREKEEMLGCLVVRCPHKIIFIEEIRTKLGTQYDYDWASQL